MDDAEIEALNNALTLKVSQYLIIKLLDRLSEDNIERVNKIADPVKIIDQLQTLLPDLDNIMMEELNNFKTEYTKKP